MLEPWVETLRRSESKEYLCQIVGTLGTAYYELNQIEDARVCYEESLNLAREAGDKQAIATCLNELSMVAGHEGNLERAIKLSRESIQVGLDEGLENSVALHNLSILYQETRQFEEAKEILEIVKESCESRYDLEGLGKALNELGLVYYELKDSVKAIASLYQSIMVKRQIGDAYGAQVSLRNLGMCVQTHPETLSNPEVIRLLTNLDQP
jgi:tetratricopeptide (TPR) repeat protein